jgi:hypothetical protein
MTKNENLLVKEVRNAEEVLMMSFCGFPSRWFDKLIKSPVTPVEILLYSDGKIRLTAPVLCAPARPSPAHLDPVLSQSLSDLARLCIVRVNGGPILERTTRIRLVTVAAVGNARSAMRVVVTGRGKWCLCFILGRSTYFHDSSFI